MSLQELMANIDTSIDVSKLDIELFTLALTHSSYAIDNSLGKLANNERLEFYGDSVLKLACSKFLYETFPNEREGLLSSYRSILVSDAFLAKYATEINLKKYINVSNRPDLKTQRAEESISSCAFEAVLGALFMQVGFDVVYSFLNRFFVSYLPFVKENLQKINAKATLQEFTQNKSKILPEYELIAEEGEDHNKLFSVQVKYLNRIVGKGKAHSKKEAEQVAAYNACVKLGVLNE